MALLDRFTTDIGIDLGTCNTLVYVCGGQGIVIDEPSVVAIEKTTAKVVAVGNEAKRMLYRTPDDIVAIRPLRDGVISDSTSTEKMIRYFISKVLPKHHLFRSVRMKIGIPSCITPVERHAVVEAAMKTGAKSVEVIEESLAAAIGAQIPIFEPQGHMVCDIGGGTTEVSVISLGGMVCTNAIRVGGDAFDEAIVNYVRNNLQMSIGLQTAEKLKIDIGNVMETGTEPKECTIKGSNNTDNLPKSKTINSIQIREALREPVSKVVEVIKKTIGETPPELVSDISENGIVMTGGGSKLGGLDKLIEQETGVSCIIAPEPLVCVAKGAGEAFELYNNMSENRSIYNSLNK